MSTTNESDIYIICDRHQHGCNVSYCNGCLLSSQCLYIRITFKSLCSQSCFFIITLIICYSRAGSTAVRHIIKYWLSISRFFLHSSLFFLCWCQVKVFHINKTSWNIYRRKQCFPFPCCKSICCIHMDIGNIHLYFYAILAHFDLSVIV